MKRIFTVFCSIAVIFSAFIIHVNTTKGAYKNTRTTVNISRMKNDSYCFFKNGSEVYFVSVSGEKIIINKINKRSGCKAKSFFADSEILSCEFAGGNFYFHCKNKEKQISVVICNYERSTVRSQKFADFQNNNKFLWTVDKYGCYYTVDTQNRYQLLKYSQNGELIGKYDFENNIFQVTGCNGEKIIAVTGGEIYNVDSKGITKISDGFCGFPVQLINKKLLKYNTKFYDTENNCKTAFSNIKYPAAAGLNGVYYSKDDKIFYMLYGNKKASAYFLNGKAADELFYSGSYIYALTGEEIAIIKITDFTAIEETDKTSEEKITDIKSQIGSTLYKLQGGYVLGIHAKTTTKQFKSVMIYGDNDISFLYNGIPFTQGNIKTGTKVFFENKNGEKVQYTAIVDGDVDSNGSVTSSDTKDFADFLLGIKRLNDNEKIAADLNSDNILSNNDLIKIARLRNR